MIIPYYLLLLLCAQGGLLNTFAIIFDVVTVGWKIVRCPTVPSTMNTFSETPCKYNRTINHVLEFVDDSVEFLPGAGDPRVPVRRFPENRYSTRYTVFGPCPLF